MSTLRPSRARASQPITTKGMGVHFSSPRKKRNKKKTSTIVTIPGHALKRQKLHDEIEALLLAPSSIEPSVSENHSFQAASPIPEPTEPQENLPMELEDTSTFESEVHCDSAAAERVRTPCTTSSLCASWKAIIPTIIEPFINYTAATVGKPLSVLSPSISSCVAHCQEQKSTAVLCLCFDRKYLQYVVTSLVNCAPPGFVSINVISCYCSTLPQTLVSYGLFPTAPSQPRMAVSVELLEFYRALFERSCDAINALAATLSTYYTRRGFRVTNRNVSGGVPLCSHYLLLTV